MVWRAFYIIRDVLGMLSTTRTRAALTAIAVVAATSVSYTHLTLPTTPYV